MKKTKMDNSFKLNGISIALAAVLGLVFSTTTFAAEKDTKQEIPKEVKKEDLSQKRMEIQKEKLEQELEKEKLTKLRIKADQAKILDQINGVGTGPSGSSNDAYMPQVPRATDEDRIATEGGIPQNVGYIYRSDAVDTSTNQSGKKSNNILDTLTGKKGKSDSTDIDGKDELSKVLEKFDEYKKVSDSKVKVMSEYVVKKTLLDTQLDMLSIFDDSKTAKLRFSYLHDDGIQKKKVISIVSVREGKVFKVEDDTFKVDKIDSDGLVIVNLKTQEESIITKNN